jgi:hypothetical protein
VPVPGVEAAEQTLREGKDNRWARRGQPSGPPQAASARRPGNAYPLLGAGRVSPLSTGMLERLASDPDALQLMLWFLG